MHSKRWKLAVLGLLLAVLLAGCLPEGGIFGHGGSSPRPEFAGSPMAGGKKQAANQEQGRLPGRLHGNRRTRNPRICGNLC